MICLLYTSITTLTLGFNFNQPLTGVDFKGITTLTLGNYFNQPLAGVDFKEIATLTLGQYFNQPLAGVDFKRISQIFPSKFRDYLRERPVSYTHLDVYKRQLVLHSEVASQ